MNNFNLPAGYFVFDGCEAERIKPEKCNIIRLTVMIIRCDLLSAEFTAEEHELSGKTITVDVDLFRLRALFKSMMYEKKIHDIESFLQQFSKERFFGFIDEKGKLSGVISLSKVEDSQSV
ncbi:UNVERIFIED_ORG: hypothetical protein M2355_001938 [Lelliottia amnigena]|jgi:hypothetical protein|uniref:hypothetical protein n=1 Tax=Lelliottia nimipressuralis TaxID=69220 RepID=UPI00247C9AD6|nr:hypothetical protein [Lelliottia amnigena]